MADFVAKRDMKSPQPKKKKGFWSRLCCLLFWKWEELYPRILKKWELDSLIGYLALTCIYMGKIINFSFKKVGVLWQMLHCKHQIPDNLYLLLLFDWLKLRRAGIAFKKSLHIYRHFSWYFHSFYDEWYMTWLNFFNSSISWT